MDKFMPKITVIFSGLIHFHIGLPIAFESFLSLTQKHSYNFYSGQGNCSGDVLKENCKGDKSDE